MSKTDQVIRFLPCEKHEFNHCCKFDDFTKDGAMQWKEWTKTLKIYAFCWLCLLIIAIIFTAITAGLQNKYDDWVDSTQLYSNKTNCDVIASGWIDQRDNDECVYREDVAQRYDFVIIYKPNCSSYSPQNDKDFNIPNYSSQQLVDYLLSNDSINNESTSILDEYNLLDYTEPKKDKWQCIYNTSDSIPKYENSTKCWVNIDCTQITMTNYFEGDDDLSWLDNAATTMLVFSSLFWIACGGWWLIEFCIYPRHPKDCIVTWICLPFLCLCSNN